MNGDVQAVRGIDLDVGDGEMVGVVGESGSGKSVTFLGLMGLLPKSAKISGSATIGGVELVGAPDKLMRTIRGKRIAMIFQDPLSALNPVQKIGVQIVEMIQSHQDIKKPAALLFFFFFRSHTRTSRRRLLTARPSSCSTWWGFRSPNSERCSTRTSSRAACASA